MQVGRVKHVDVQLESVTWALRSPFLERVKNPILRLKVTFAQLKAIFSPERVVLGGCKTVTKMSKMGLPSLL